MKLNKILNQQLHVRFTSYCLVIKFFMLYSAKYKKTGFKSSAQEDATFHSTFISHTQIGGKLKNNLNNLLKKCTVHVLRQTTVPTSHHWRRLQHTFWCFRTKTPCGQENEATQEKSCDVQDVVNKKDCFLLCFVQNIWYLVGTSDITTISNDWGNILQILCKTSLEKKKRVSLCSASAWIRTHATFLVILKRCCHFSVVQSFQSEFATHLMYIQGKHSRSIDRKYNYRECWCYIINIKWCFPRTKQWLVLHVLAICL